MMELVKDVFSKIIHAPKVIRIMEKEFVFLIHHLVNFHFMKVLMVHVQLHVSLDSKLMLSLENVILINQTA